MKSLTTLAKVYLILTYVLGAVLFALHVTEVSLVQPGMLTLLCVFASLSLILRVEGSTRNSHYSFNFLVYGFTFAVLGTAETIVVIIVSNVVEKIWNKQAWYIQLFNISTYIISIQAAGIVYPLVNPGPAINTWQTVLSILLSMVTFNFVNHLMIGIVLWLARGENLKQSGIFEFFSLMLDLALLIFGASMSFVWNYNPYALGLFLIPLYLIYNTLRVPALERQTEIDSKTGLFNHEYFKKYMINELTRANRFDRPLSIILADLDLLRNVNNTYGHLAGDEVLIGVAKAMKDSVREYDVVCRFGGEEFAILLPETSLSQAYERAETLRKAIENLEFIVPTSVTPIRATMSFGVSNRESFSQTADEIVHSADLALYHSKLSGRNRSFAYVDETYVDYVGKNADEQSSSEAPSLKSSTKKDEITNRNPPIVNEEPALAEISDPTVETASNETNVPKEKRKSRTSKYAVVIFIGLLTIISLLSFLTILKWLPEPAPLWKIDWFGLSALLVLIILSEGFSIDLYTRRTSVSTSAIPILTAYLIFGPIGTLCVSLVLALALALKYHSPISRFMFNFSNHLLAGSLTLGIVGIIGNNFLEIPVLFQIILSLLSAFSLYLVTTLMVAIGMSLDLNQSVHRIWQEQFSWLAPYYVGIGFITYTMIFGYKHANVPGLMLMVIPMFLLRVSQKQYVDRTTNIVTELREKNQILQKTSDEIAEINEGLLTTLSEIIDLRDPYVLGHSRQVSNYACEIAQKLNLNNNQIRLIRKAGLLHDIGKIGIPMEILTKPDKLTRGEYETIKEHAALGSDIVKNSPSLRSLVPIIRHHHEYYNGKGYPDKLKGNQISIEARIISVADAIEAMTSDRPYRKSLKIEDVMKELDRNSGSQFDPLVVESALQMLEAMISGEKASSERTETRVSRQHSPLAGTS